MRYTRKRPAASVLPEGHALHTQALAASVLPPPSDHLTSTARRTQQCTTMNRQQQGPNERAAPCNNHNSHPAHRPLLRCCCHSSTRRFSSLLASSSSNCRSSLAARFTYASSSTTTLRSSSSLEPDSADSARAGNLVADDCWLSSQLTPPHPSAKPPPTNACSEGDEQDQRAALMRIPAAAVLYGEGLLPVGRNAEAIAVLQAATHIRLQAANTRTQKDGQTDKKVAKHANRNTNR